MRERERAEAIGCLSVSFAFGIAPLGERHVAAVDEQADELDRRFWQLCDPGSLWQDHIDHPF